MSGPLSSLSFLTFFLFFNKYLICKCEKTVYFRLTLTLKVAKSSLTNLFGFGYCSTNLEFIFHIFIISRVESGPNTSSSL